MSLLHSSTSRALHTVLEALLASLVAAAKQSSLPKMTCLAMIVTLHLTHTGQMKNKFGLHDGGDDGEHNGVGILEVSEIFEAQDAFFFGTIQLKEYIVPGRGRVKMKDIGDAVDRM